MNVLFKYYDELPKSYFNDPTMKICSTKKLNDPFERIIEKDLVRLTLEARPDFNNVRRNYSPIKDNINFLNSPIDQSEALRSIFHELNLTYHLERIGVISLTETPRNLLMWSHYANQHKGICIGYKADFLDDKLNTHHPSLPVAYHPLKVNYDNVRHDPYTDVFSLSDESLLRKEVILKTLLTKGNDWIYEKEHRCIIPMEYNDHIFYKGTKNTHDYANGKYKSIIIPDNENNMEFKLAQNNNFNIHPLIDDNDLIFRMRIKKESITSIYLGCGSEIYDDWDLFDMIKSDTSLSHISVYKMMPSHSKFELQIIPFEEFVPSTDEI